MSAAGGIARAEGGARGALLYAAFGALALLVFVSMSALGTDRSRPFVYASDSVYADLAISRNLLEQGFLGVGEERLPAQRDALWQIALAAAARLGAPPAAAPVFTALLLSLAGLIATLSLVRAVYPRGAWAAWACAAWGLMLPAAADASGGLSTSVAASFATLGIAAHARGIGPSRTALPLSAAFWIGLAALFRIEMLAIWIALGLHTLILALLRRAPIGVVAALIRALNGGFVAAILLCPAIWWNMKTLSVPWPTMPDASMTLDAVGVASVGDAFTRGLTKAAYAMVGGGVWGGGLIAVFIVGGIAWLLVDLARGRVGMSATTLLIGLLVPLPFAALHPFWGAEALPHIQRAVLPLWMLTAGYLAVRASETIAEAARRKTPQLPESTVFLAAMALIGAMPVLAGLRDQVAAVRRLRAARMEAHESRAALAERLGPPEHWRGGSIASDEPGWLMFRRYADVVDLGGRFHPVVLNWISGSGVRSEAGLRDYLVSRGVRTAVVWREPRDRFGRVFECPPGAGPGPAVCRVSPASIP
jgi:hypothetical protein